jgi:hypothetical protein
VLSGTEGWCASGSAVRWYVERYAVAEGVMGGVLVGVMAWVGSCGSGSRRCESASSVNGYRGLWCIAL